MQQYKPTKEDICGALQSAESDEIVLECIAAFCEREDIRLITQTFPRPRLEVIDIYQRRAGTDSGKDHWIKGFPRLLTGLASTVDSKISISVLGFEEKARYVVFLGSTTQQLIGILKVPVRNIAE